MAADSRYDGEQLAQRKLAAGVECMVQDVCCARVEYMPVVRKWTSSDVEVLQVLLPV